MMEEDNIIAHCFRKVPPLETVLRNNGWYFTKEKLPTESNFYLVMLKNNVTEELGTFLMKFDADKQKFKRKKNWVNIAWKDLKKQ